MGANVNPLQLKTASPVSRDVTAKVRALVAKAKYEAPKVISFPVQDMKTSHALSMVGNVS